jgi:hypothetical protein
MIASEDQQQFTLPNDTWSDLKKHEKYVCRAGIRPRSAETAHTVQEFWQWVQNCDVQDWIACRVDCPVIESVYPSWLCWLGRALKGRSEIMGFYNVQ